MHICMRVCAYVYTRNLQTIRVKLLPIDARLCIRLDRPGKLENHSFSHRSFLLRSRNVHGVSFNFTTETCTRTVYSTKKEFHAKVLRQELKAQTIKIILISSFPYGI